MRTSVPPSVSLAAASSLGRGRRRRCAKPLLRLPQRLDLPQGLLEKIEFQLLLAEPTLQLGDPPLRARQVVRLGRRHDRALGPSRPTQQLIARLRCLAPFIEPLPRNPELPSQRRNLHPRRHQRYRRTLELDCQLRSLPLHPVLLPRELSGFLADSLSQVGGALQSGTLGQFLDGLSRRANPAHCWDSSRRNP